MTGDFCDSLEAIMSLQGSCEATITHAAGMQELGVSQKGVGRGSLILHQQVLITTPQF